MTPDDARPGDRNTLWIVSPTLFDTTSMIRLRDQIADACATELPAHRIHHVVVDDSSGTDPEIGRLGALPDVTVLTPPFNLGHQRAIVYGLRTLISRLEYDDIVVTMDSDGEDQAQDVPRLVRALAEHDVPLAVARRTERTEPFGFRVLYVCFRLLFRVLSGTTVRSGNFAAQRAPSLAVTINHPSFDLCYSSTLLALRRPTTNVPCARGRRLAGESRMSKHALIAHGIRMMLPFSERIAVRMMVLATASLGAFVTALALAVAGVGGGAVLFITAMLALLFLASLTAFVVLFSGFGQSSSLAVRGISIADSITFNGRTEDG